MYAPVAVFAYNRPAHLRVVLDSLKKNVELLKSPLYIYIDGPKDDKGYEVYWQVLKVAQDFKDKYLGDVNIISSERNSGLAVSIISGVTRLIERYEKVIVVEDDSEVSVNFLHFMNQALDFYEHNPRIWSIGGFSLPMKIPNEYLSDAITTQRVSSYAWATWKNRWESIDWSVKDYSKFRFNLRQRKCFNRWGKDRASMLDDQMNDRINSWAIRFDYAMFKNNMYNIIPTYSLVSNIGHDGSGTHNLRNKNEEWFNIKLAKGQREFILESMKPNEAIRKEFIKFFRVTFLNRIKRYIRNQWIYQRKASKT